MATNSQQPNGKMVITKSLEDEQTEWYIHSLYPFNLADVQGEARVLTSLQVRSCLVEQDFTSLLNNLSVKDYVKGLLRHFCTGSDTEMGNMDLFSMLLDEALSHPQCV